jgi:hypothetical protein
MTKHQLIGGVLVGSETLGVLEYKEREREREGGRKRGREAEKETYLAVGFTPYQSQTVFMLAIFTLKA